MAVTFGGLPEGISSWSVEEDATSLDRGDAPSGVPVLSATGVGSQMRVLGLQDAPISVLSTDFGALEMVAIDAELSADAWTVSGGSPLHKLVQIGRVQHGMDLRADRAVARFFAAVGVTTSEYTLVTHDLDSRLFTVPAWNKMVWSGLRQWLSANELDLLWIDGELHLMPMRTRAIYLQDLSAEYGLSLDADSLAKRVDVNIYHRTSFSRGLVYPVKDSLYPDAEQTFGEPGFTTISVEAGQTVETTLQLGAEVESIRQPVMVTAIPTADGQPNVTPAAYPNGIYMIVGNDNKRIMPAQWRDMGGGLSVKLNDDHRSVTVTLSGMNYSELSPYRIAESDDKNDYCGLFLMADNGQYVDIETMRFSTGVGAKSDDVVSIDNPSITDATQAIRAAQAAADKATGHALTLTWSGPDPVRSSWGDRVRQAFGRIPGVRFLLRGHWWRADSASFGDNGVVSVSADRDTSLADLQVRYPVVRDLQASGMTLKTLSNIGVLE